MLALAVGLVCNEIRRGRLYDLLDLKFGYELDPGG